MMILLGYDVGWQNWFMTLKSCILSSEYHRHTKIMITSVYVTTNTICCFDNIFWYKDHKKVSCNVNIILYEVFDFSSYQLRSIL